MSTPGQSRGRPAFDDPAADVMRQLRGERPQYALPPPDWDPAYGYERAELSDEERAEAQKAADEEARICKYCIGIHRYPTTVACPRIAEATLDKDGKLTSVKFREDSRWAKRAVLLEDMHESEEAGDA